MLEINKIKNQTSEIIQRLKKRNIDISQKINQVLELNNERITNQQKLDAVLGKSNKLAQSIGTINQAQNKQEFELMKQEASNLKKQAKELTHISKLIEKDIHNNLIKIPNTPHKSVPQGNSDQDNEKIFEWADDVNEGANLLPHWKLAEKYNIIDFKRGSQIAGSGFPLYKGMGAKLQRGLINFFLDYNVKAGYTEYIPPYFVNEESAFNTGQVPDKEGMMYHMTNDNLYAIPTAEVPITNIFRKMRIKEEDLPIKCTAYSPCFRREAGSYGQDVRGLNRLHQFDKVEIVQICAPSQSYRILEDMVQHVSELLKKLELQFRIVKLCGGDLGFTSALTYDFEVYAPGQKKWLEVSSVSNFETYQSNRLKLKCLNEGGETSLCHTLNGSALALPRIVAAILEKNQKEQKIIMPNILVNYLGFKEITI